MDVAYYYNQAKRLPADHYRNNPYGSLLCEALERLGHRVRFELDLSTDFLHDNRSNIDVLHLNWPQYVYYDDDRDVMERRMRDLVASMELARKLGYKIVWTAHNLYPHNRTHRAIDHEFRLQICRLATALIVHCDVAAAAVQQHFGRQHNLFVIPHGHFIGVHKSDVSREEARRTLGIPANDFVYGFFGNLLPYKGVERLIDCFRQLEAADAWLLIAGGGRHEYLETIDRHVGELARVLLRTTFPKAPNEDLLLVLQAADVIVLPFVSTMTSGTLILALSWSKPVIAPAIGCLPMTTQPQAGILFKPDEAGSLQRAMQEIRNRDLATAAQAAFSSVSHLDWDGIAQRTVDAYQA